MPTIEFEGIEELDKILKKNAKLTDVKRIVRHNGSELQERAQDEADFRGHYGWVKGKGKCFIPPTGKLKGSIGLDITDGGLAAEVEPSAEYAAYVELGTRKMDAQPYLKPAWNVQKAKFHRDMQKLVK